MSILGKTTIDSIIAPIQSVISKLEAFTDKTAAEVRMSEEYIQEVKAENALKRSEIDRAQKLANKYKNLV